MQMKKVPKVDLEKVVCDFDNCVSRGEFSQCYTQNHLICTKYLTHKQYLNDVKKLRNKNKSEKKITHKEETLVFCDKKDCPDRGEYMKCYFDLYRNCRLYN